MHKPRNVIEREARPLSREISEHLKALMLTKRAYGETVRQRSNAADAAARALYLKHGWSDMPSNHRLDNKLYEHFKTAAKPADVNDVHRKIMLFLHMNVEDLSKDANFIQLFEARATRPAENFIMHDLELANIASMTHTSSACPELEGVSTLPSGGLDPLKNSVLQSDTDFKPGQLRYQPDLGLCRNEVTCIRVQQGSFQS